MKDLITDSGIVLGIMNNDPKVWRYIYKRDEERLYGYAEETAGLRVLE